MEGPSSGVAEMSRFAAAAADGRERLLLVADLGKVADLRGGGTDFWFFFRGASGWGHSTS